MINTWREEHQRESFVATNANFSNFLSLLILSLEHSRVQRRCNRRQESWRVKVSEVLGHLTDTQSDREVRTGTGKKLDCDMETKLIDCW